MSAQTRAGSLHDTVLEVLGLDITAGRLAPGDTVSIDELATRHEVSRSVVREVLRVLAAQGLVESRRKVGTVVMPSTSWNLYDPTVIRWRLADRDRLGQLHSLTELREAVEPMSAGLAARRASGAQAARLVALAAQLWEAGVSGDVEGFLAIDVEFHRGVLDACGNEMFAHLGSVVTEVLVGRTHYGLTPERPKRAALQDHLDVASAIQRGEGDTAHDAMRRIMRRSSDEMDALWDRQQDA